MQPYPSENKDKTQMSGKAYTARSQSSTSGTSTESRGYGDSGVSNIHSIHNAPYSGHPSQTSGVQPSMPETRMMPKKQISQLPPIHASQSTQMNAIPSKKVQIVSPPPMPYNDGPPAIDVVPVSMPPALVHSVHASAITPASTNAMQQHPQAITAASKVGVLQPHGKKIPTALFMMGGPGAGIETQAKLISQEYSMLHVSILDLYLAEWCTGSPAGKVIAQCLGLPPSPQVGLFNIDGESITTGVAPSDIQDIMSLPIHISPSVQFQAVPPHISVCLLQNILEFHTRKGRLDFLITGFPLSLPDWEAWSLALGDYCQVAGVLWLDCPLDKQRDSLLSETTDTRIDLLHTVMSNVCVDVRERDCLQYMRDNVTIVCSFPANKADDAGANGNNTNNTNLNENNTSTNNNYKSALTTSGSAQKLQENHVSEYALQILLPEAAVMQSCVLFSKNTIQLRDLFVAAGRIKLVDASRPPLQVYRSLAPHLQPFKHLIRKKIQKNSTELWNNNQKPTVILMMGGPGAGCTTMTERILYKYRLTDIDVPALVRLSQGGNDDDLNSTGRVATVKTKKPKKPLSPEALVELIQAHLEQLMHQHEKYHFLLRGFPSNLPSYNAFMGGLLPLINQKLIMQLDCPEHIRRQRLISAELENSQLTPAKVSMQNLHATKRSGSLSAVSSTGDFYKPSITQQQAEARVAPKLQRFLLQTSPVISELIHVGNFVTVDTSKTADVVWHQVDAVLKERIPGIRNFAFAPLAVLNPHMTRIVHGEEPSDEYDTENSFHKAIVVWLLGGPGSGRRRIAARLCRDYLIHPIIVHDLHLRVVHKGSPEEREVAMKCLSDGSPQPASLTAKLIKHEILLQMRRNNRKAFLVIGSTERVEDLDNWQLELSTISHVSHAIHLTASHKVRMQRKTAELRGRLKTAVNTSDNTTSSTQTSASSPTHKHNDTVIVDVEAARLLRVEMTRYATITVPLIKEILFLEPGSLQPSFFTNTCAILPPSATLTSSSGKPLGFGVVEVPSEGVSESHTYAAVKASFTHLRMLSTEYARKMQAFSMPEKPSVILIAGPPGAGSSTVTKYIKQYYQVESLDVEYVLQQACLKNTADGNLVQYLRKTGQTVPAETIVNQMQQIIMQKSEEGNKFFVVSNFPSYTGDWNEWRRCIEPLADIVAIIILDCPEAVCAQRLGKEVKDEPTEEEDVVDTTAIKNATDVARVNWPITGEYSQRRKQVLAALEPVLRQYVDVKHKHSGVYEFNYEKIVVESPPTDIIRILHTNVPEQKIFANLALILADMHWLLRRAIEIRANSTTNPVSNRVIMQKIRIIEDEEDLIREKESSLMELNKLSKETESKKRIPSGSAPSNTATVNNTTDNVDTGVAQVLLICGATGSGAEYVGTVISQLYDITAINVEALVRQFAYSDSVEALTLPSHVTFGANTDDTSIITAQASVQAQLRESVRAALKQGYGVNPHLIMALIRNRVRYLRDQQGIHRFLVCGLPLAWNDKVQEDGMSTVTSTWKLWRSDVDEHGIVLCGVISLDVPYSILKQRIEQSESINVAMNQSSAGEEDATQSANYISVLNAKLALLRSSLLPQLDNLPVELYEQFDPVYAQKYKEMNEGVALFEQDQTTIDSVAPFLFRRVVSASPCGASQLHRVIEFLRKVFPDMALTEAGKHVKLPPRPSPKQDLDDVNRALLFSTEDKELESSQETPQNLLLSRVLGSDIVQKGRVTQTSSSIHLLHHTGSSNISTTLPLPLPHQPSALASVDEQVVREPLLQVILLSGAPGSGAVALGVKLEYLYDILFLNVDDLIRACVLSPTSSPQSRVLVPLVANGMLPPAEIVVHIVLAALREARKQRHYHICLHGFPNSVDALKIWDTLLSPIANIVMCIYIETSADVASQRSLEEWHSITGLPAQAGVSLNQVEVDGVETTIESGPVHYPVPGDADWQGVACTPAALAKLLDGFEKYTIPVLKKLSQTGIVVKINGDEPTDRVLQRVAVALKKVNYHVSLNEVMKTSGMVVPDHVTPLPHLCIFVVGPRASGKSAICSSLAQMYSLQHVAVNQLILKEMMIGSPYGNEFRIAQEQKKQYPASLVVDVIRRHVTECIRSLGNDYQQFYINYIQQLLALSAEEEAGNTNVTHMKEKLITEATRTLSRLRTPVFLIDGLPTSAETFEAIQLLFGRDGSDPFVLNIVASHEKCNSNLAKAQLSGEGYIYRDAAEDAEWEEGAKLIIQAAESSSCGGLAKTARIRDADSLEAAIMVRVRPVLEEMLGSVLLLNARAIAALVSFHMLHSKTTSETRVISLGTYDVEAIETMARSVLDGKKSKFVKTSPQTSNMEEYKDIMDDVTAKSQVAIVNRTRALKEQGMLQEQQLALESSSMQLLHGLQATSGPEMIAKHISLLSSDHAITQFLQKANKSYQNNQRNITLSKPSLLATKRIPFSPPTANIIPIFLLGTPFSGKSSLASGMALNLGVVHLNVSTILYMESRLCTTRANIIADFARVNRRPSPGLVVNVLQGYIEQYVLNGKNVFLIENFPLSTEEWCEWTRQLGGDEDAVVMLQSQYNTVLSAMLDAKSSILGPGVELTTKGVRHTERVRVGSILQQAEEQANKNVSVTSHFLVLETTPAVALERLTSQRSNGGVASYEDSSPSYLDAQFKLYQSKTLPMLRAAASLLGKACGASVTFLDGKSDKYVCEANVISLLASLLCNVEASIQTPRVPALLPPAGNSNSASNTPQNLNFTVLPIFLLGGPGAGKLTLAHRLAQTLGITHIDPVALLEAEVNNKTRYAAKIVECARSGNLIPGEISAAVIIKAISSLAETQRRSVVVVNGFPTCMESWNTWVQAVSDNTSDDDVSPFSLGICLHLDCPRDVRVRRLVRQEEQSVSAKKNNRNNSTSIVVPSSLTSRLGYGMEAGVSYTRGVSASIEKATWNHEHTTLYAEHMLQHSPNVLYHITNSAEPLEGVVAKASFWIATQLSSLVIYKQQFSRMQKNAELSVLGPYYSASSIPALPQLAPAFASLCTHINHLLLSNSISPAVVMHALSYSPAKASPSALKSALVPIEILKANSAVFTRYVGTAPSVRNAIIALDSSLPVKNTQNYSLARPTPQMIHIIGPVGCGAVKVADAIATSFEVIIIDAELLIQQHAQNELARARDKEAGISVSSDGPLNNIETTAATISLGNVSATLFTQLVQKEVLSKMEDSPHVANFVIANFPCSIAQWNQWVRVCKGTWGIHGVLSIDCSEDFCVNSLLQRGLSLERISHVMKDYNTHTLPLLSLLCKSGGSIAAHPEIPVLTNEVFVVPVNAAQPISSILQMIDVNLKNLKIPVINKNAVLPVSITNKPSLDADLVKLHHTPLVVFVHAGPGSGVEHVLSSFLRSYKNQSQMLQSESLKDAQCVSIDMAGLCLAESKKNTSAGALLRHCLARSQPIPPFISAGLLRTFIWEHMTRTILKSTMGTNGSTKTSGSYLNNATARTMSALKCVYFVVGYTCDIPSMEAWCKIANVSEDLTDIYSQVHSLWFHVDEKVRISNLLRAGETKYTLLTKTARYNTQYQSVQKWSSEHGVVINIDTCKFHTVDDAPVQPEAAIPHFIVSVDSIIRAAVAQRKLALHNMLAKADAVSHTDPAVSSGQMQILSIISTDALAAHSIATYITNQFKCQYIDFAAIAAESPESYTSAIAGATLLYRTMQFSSQHDHIQHFVVYGFPRSKDDIQCFNSVSANCVKMQFSVLNGVVSCPKVLSDGTVVSKYALPSYASELLVYTQKMNIPVCHMHVNSNVLRSAYFHSKSAIGENHVEVDGKQYLVDANSNSDKTQLLVATNQAAAWTQYDVLGEGVILDHHLRYNWGSVVRYRSHTPSMAAAEVFSNSTNANVKVSTSVGTTKLTNKVFLLSLTGNGGHLLTAECIKLHQSHHFGVLNVASIRAYIRVLSCVQIAIEEGNMKTVNMVSIAAKAVTGGEKSNINMKTQSGLSSYDMATQTLKQCLEGGLLYECVHMPEFTPAMAPTLSSVLETILYASNLSHLTEVKASAMQYISRNDLDATIIQREAHAVCLVILWILQFWSVYSHTATSTRLHTSSTNSLRVLLTGHFPSEPEATQWKNVTGTSVDESLYTISIHVPSHVAQARTASDPVHVANISSTSNTTDNVYSVVTSDMVVVAETLNKTLDINVSTSTSSTDIGIQINNWLAMLEDLDQSKLTSSVTVNGHNVKMKDDSTAIDSVVTAIIGAHELAVTSMPVVRTKKPELVTKTHMMGPTHNPTLQYGFTRLSSTSFHGAVPALLPKLPSIAGVIFVVGPAGSNAKAACSSLASQYDVSWLDLANLVFDACTANPKGPLARAIRRLFASKNLALEQADDNVEHFAITPFNVGITLAHLPPALLVSVLVSAIYNESNAAKVNAHDSATNSMLIASRKWFIVSDFPATLSTWAAWRVTSLARTVTHTKIVHFDAEPLHSILSIHPPLLRAAQEDAYRHVKEEHERKKVKVNAELAHLREKLNNKTVVAQPLLRTMLACWYEQVASYAKLRADTLHKRVEAEHVAAEANIAAAALEDVDLEMSENARVLADITKHLVLFNASCSNIPQSETSVLSVLRVHKASSSGGLTAPMAQSTASNYGIYPVYESALPFVLPVGDGLPRGGNQQMSELIQNILRSEVGQRYIFTVSYNDYEDGQNNHICSATVTGNDLIACLTTGSIIAPLTVIQGYTEKQPYLILTPGSLTKINVSENILEARAHELRSKANEMKEKYDVRIASLRAVQSEYEEKYNQAMQGADLEYTGEDMKRMYTEHSLIRIPEQKNMLDILGDVISAQDVSLDEHVKNASFALNSSSVRLAYRAYTRYLDNTQNDEEHYQSLVKELETLNQTVVDENTKHPLNEAKVLDMLSSRDRAQVVDYNACTLPLCRLLKRQMTKEEYHEVCPHDGEVLKSVSDGELGLVEGKELCVSADSTTKDSTESNLLFEKMLLHEYPALEYIRLGGDAKERRQAVLQQESQQQAQKSLILNAEDAPIVTSTDTTEKTSHNNEVKSNASLFNTLTFITGGPGCGKTTIANALKQKYPDIAILDAVSLANAEALNTASYITEETERLIISSLLRRATALRAQNIRRFVITGFPLSHNGWSELLRDPSVVRVGKTSSLISTQKPSTIFEVQKVIILDVNNNNRLQRQVKKTKNIRNAQLTIKNYESHGRNVELRIKQEEPLTTVVIDANAPISVVLEQVIKVVNPEEQPNK